MLTNLATSRNQLQWNKGCSGGILKPRSILHVDLEVTTYASSLWNVRGNRKESHAMIMDLHIKGYLDKGIAKILIARNIPTRLNKLWFAKHIWAARNYLRKESTERNIQL